MNLIIALTVILCTLCTPLENQYFINAQTSDSNSVFGNISTPAKQNETIIVDIRKLLSKYDSDQLNEVIYRLYEDFHNSNKTEIGHYHDIAILIDFICSNEYNENSVEARDITTELPIEVHIE